MAIHGKLNIEPELATIGTYEDNSKDWQEKAGIGSWSYEPFDFAVWVDNATGYTCAIKRNGGGAWCGYVYAPEDHPVHFRDVDMDEYQTDLTIGNPVWFDVHGGVTWHGKMDVQEGRAEGMAVGFDCAHSQDLIPGWKCGNGEYRSASYAIGEVRKLAKQIHEYRPLQQMVG